MQFARTMYRSFKAAFIGIGHALSERSVRIHLVLGSLVICFGLYFELATWEWCAVVLAIGLVFAAELLNTAIEKLADVVRDQNNMGQSSTKIPRDVAAGAVLLASISSAIVGLLIFLPKILA